eukprot:CAMPEP_0170497402 /NCGR_PEP_ID=MMETSP0208-20121228/24677_1 /TAXON_ID=197538 /ORGANISM="Strombidium inclinatum, Strain S3" /LENGTH=108 /DNA_ID=CAMNT_0010774207 /DNA_START=204 /DNA_END=530 /DNA_ORIENTATION=+
MEEKAKDIIFRVMAFALDQDPLDQRVQSLSSLVSTLREDNLKKKGEVAMLTKSLTDCEFTINGLKKEIDKLTSVKGIVSPRFLKNDDKMPPHPENPFSSSPREPSTEV